ncbi:hypothetical protein CB1_000781013 [Camelus ferus]|nr:hypothetical protein CB1_000781013 [Camelus ferus]
MFRRARLSVKPNVRPGAGARGSTASNPQREQEAPRPPEPTAAPAPKPAESTDVPPVGFGEAEPQEKTPKSSDEKTDGGNDVEESSKSSSTVSQRRKRVSSTSSLVKPGISVPSEPHPLSTVNQEAPQPNPVPTKEKQPCSDRYRIYKAQKLREMLKEELRKEKKQWKNKYAINESQGPPDRSKMTMRDFIYYLPDNNPMTQEGKSTPDGEDNVEVEEEMDDGPLLVPRVKVAEDGSIILDEESLSEKICLQEDNQPKAFRPSRLMRGLLQRPKPNVGKAAERKEVLMSREITEASVEKNETESCIDRDIEDQPCEKFECEDITSQSEEKDTSFQNVQSDEPTALNECLSVKEDSKANKQVPILKTRFQKPKPNIGRAGRREIFSKEELPGEILSPKEMTAALRETVRLETSPREKVPEETNTTQEMESDLKETTRKAISPREKISEMNDITVEMETDLKETGREIFLREEVPEVTDATEERETDLEESERREIPLQENTPEEVSGIGDMETGLKETEKEISPRGKTLEMIGAAKEMETDLEETEREVSTQEKASVVKTIGDEMEIDLKETGVEIFRREKVQVGICATGERKIDLEEPGNRDISLMEEVSEKISAIEETEANLKETEIENSLRKSRAEEISATEEKVTDLEKTGIDISLRKSESEETGTSRQTETHSLQSHSGDCSAVHSLNIKDISSEILSVVHTFVEEKRNSEKEVQSQLSHLETSSQASDLGKIEEQRMQSPDVPEQFSDINLSKSLPQEQKPFEVKSAPFVRSRFKRPKPNLARAASKRETTEAEKYAPGKKVEADKTETVVIQQKSEQTHILPSQHDVASLMTSRESDKSVCRQEEAVVLPCLQTEKDFSPSSSCERKEESQSTHAQEKKLVVSMGTQNKNTFQQEMKESVIQTARPVRGRLQRPRPNLRKVGQKQIIEKCEAKDTIKEERTLQKDETKKKFLTLIATEIEIISSEVSEGRMYENQSHVVPLENLPVDRIKVLDEKMSCPQQFKESNYSKIAPNRRTALSSASECEIDRSERRVRRKMKSNVPKGRGSKRIWSKTSKKEPRASKAVLVTLRASQEEDEDDTEDFESDYEEESYHLAPEELNKAPVFVPVGLRSPEPVSAQIEETMEEVVTTTSEVTDNLRMSTFAKPKLNMKKIFETSSFGTHQEFPSLFIAKGEEVEIQRETEKNASKGTELEDKNLESVTTAESKEQSKLACVHSIEETSISQEASLTERNKGQEEESEEVQISSVAPVVSSETGPHMLGSGTGPGESSIEEPLRKDYNGDSVLMLHVPEVSCNSPLPKEECKSSQNRIPEEEPTTVAEYFFSDIFIEVDETE